jgi:S1-C subfamily serine protease
MVRSLQGVLILGTVVLFQSCAVPPEALPIAPNSMTRQLVAERSSAIVVTSGSNLNNWVGRDFSVVHAPKDADGGSATPISADGYFLTADHVLAKMAGRNVFILYGKRGSLVPYLARVVWRSHRSDLALLHIPVATPYFYQWTPPESWLPSETCLLHGGISTGSKFVDGKLATALAPEGAFTGARSFKMDLPLQPGDSGGPVVDAYGRLVGINSAVEFLVPMETAFFLSSEGNRPSVRMINSLMEKDRSLNR